jgi:hypothetical protein
VQFPECGRVGVLVTDGGWETGGVVAVPDASPADEGWKAGGFDGFLKKAK